MAANITSPGRMLFEDIVPHEHRADLAPDQPVDAQSMKAILQRVAEQSPERYREISHQLLKLGAKAASETDSSFSLDDLKSPIDKAAVLAKVQVQEDKIFARKDLTPDQRDNELVKLYHEQSNAFPDRVFHAAHAAGSNLAKMVASGARGSRGQLNSNIGADWLVLDSNSNPVPIGIKSSYSEGLSPAEYFAAAYGTRKGLVATKFATRESGYLSKQLSAAAHDMVVTQSDCGTDRGIPTDPSDRDNIGAVLARSVGGHPAGSIITSRTLTDLKHKGVDSFMVRSPLTCIAPQGVCASCAGIRERGHLPALMDNLGLAAASSLGEPLSQGNLKEKHTAGVASASKGTGGFKRIDSLVQVPDTFPGGATLANRDGTVSKIEPAPQGGNYVHVDGEPHYVGAGIGLKVKPGDQLEAGDVLSDGVPNPAEIVRHKGIGEGRLYFVNAMRNAFKESGLPINRRNLEVLGRSLVNHVKIDDPEGLGHHLPDDVVEYNGLEQQYEPGPDTTLMAPGKAIGNYLHRPALHFSLGTRITPRVAKTLEKAGEHEVLAGASGPGFSPEMVRLGAVPALKEDWGAQLTGSNLSKRLLQNVHQGDATSDLHGVSFAPGLAYGLEFGKPPPGRVGY